MVAGNARPKKISQRSIRRKRNVGAAGSPRLFAPPRPSRTAATGPGRQSPAGARRDLVQV